MLKPSHNVYVIKTSPCGDNEKLEMLLNEMSKDGWDLYSMQETENENDIFYNCIFVKEAASGDYMLEDNGLFDFRPRIERIINPELDPYEMCLDILKKIKDKRERISKVKALIDGTSEDSRTVLNDEISKHINELEELKKKLLKVINPDIMESKLGEERLSVSVSEELAPLLNSSSDDNLLSQIVFLRQSFTERTGYIIPKIKIEIDETLEENEFSVKVRGIPAVNSCACCNRTMFIENELNIEKLPEDAIKSTDKITNSSAVWITDDTAKDYWIKGLSASEYIAAVIENVILKYIDDIFDYSDVSRYIEITSNQNLFLVDNIIPDYLSISELKYILSSLVKEKVSIKDIVFIFEKINDLTYLEDKEELLSHLRISLRRQISASLCGEKENIINAYELSTEFLKAFAHIDTDTPDDSVRVERSRVKAAVKRTEEKLKENPDLKELVLIAPAEIRHIVSLVLQPYTSNVRVISHDEIAPGYNLKILGKI